VRKKRDHEADSRPGFVNELQTKVSEHRLPIFAAAVAFFAFLALIPAVAAAVSITGLVADTDVLIREAESALENSPAPTRDFVVEQIRSVAEGSSGSAGAAAAIGIAISILSASGAVGNLMEALNVVFGRQENRNFAVKRLTAIGLLIGAIVLVVAMVFAMSILPAQIDDWFSSQWTRALITTGRFVVLGLLMVGGLSVLYHIGPAKDVERDGELVSGGTMQLISKGAMTGAVLLVLLSWGFGVFVNNFGSYGETYGTLATIIVVLLWLQLMALAVLTGAEVDARIIQERVRDARVNAGLSPTLPTLERE
jgi:membrane protein